MSKRQAFLDLVLAFGALFVLVVAVRAAWAQRSDTWSPGAVQVQQVHLTANADGTYGLSVCAAVRSDKGVTLESCEQAVVRGAGRRTQLDNLFNAARDVWIQQQGMGADAGAL